MIFLMPSLLILPPAQLFPGLHPCWRVTRHASSYPFPPFASGSWWALGRCWDNAVSVFQEEASRLKQDSSALLGLVDTSLAQYRALQSRVGQWEEEAKQLLQGQEGERAVRVGWRGVIPSRSRSLGEGLWPHHCPCLAVKGSSACLVQDWTLPWGWSSDLSVCRELMVQGLTCTSPPCKAG